MIGIIHLCSYSDANNCWPTLPFPILVKEHQVRPAHLQNDILRFLDSKMYDQSNNDVLVMCEINCERQLLNMVIKLSSHQYGISN